MSSVQPSSSRSRSTTIDAFRGIAAGGVLIEHLLLCSNDPMIPALHSALFYTPFEALFSDGKFIRFFFVISGFVMFLPLAKPGVFSWPLFYRRRFWRIYPMFLIATALAVVVHLAISNPAGVRGATDWFAHEGHPEHITPALVLQMLLLTGTHDATMINCVIWSLVEEVRAIVLFPLLAYCVCRNGAVTLAVCIALTVPANIGYPAVGETGFFITAESPLGALCATLHFLPLFIIGMVMAQNHARIAELLVSRALWQRAMLWGLAFILVRRNNESVGGIGSALVIALSIHSARATQLLATAPFQWMGRTSYGVYLLHMPIIVATLHILDGWLPLPVGLIVALALSLAAGWLFETTVGAAVATRRKPTGPVVSGEAAQLVLIATSQ